MLRPDSYQSPDRMKPQRGRDMDRPAPVLFAPPPRVHRSVWSAFNVAFAAAAGSAAAVAVFAVIAKLV